MTKEQLIEIAKAGFPEKFNSYIDYTDVEATKNNHLYRLYKGKDRINLRGWFIEIYKEGDSFVQIRVGLRVFNDLAAINKMKELEIIK